METFSDIPLRLRMAADAGDDSLYPIAVLIDELRNEDVQVCRVVDVMLVQPQQIAGVNHSILS